VDLILISTVASDGYGFSFLWDAERRNWSWGLDARCNGLLLVLVGYPN
jgi:hypothetical protein